MSEPNPWDMEPSLLEKPTKSQKSRSQILLASRLRTNILTGGHGFHPPNEMGLKSKLLKFGAAFFSGRHSSIPSPLYCRNGELSTHKENIAPPSLHSFCGQCSPQKPGFELKGNPLNLSTVNRILDPPSIEKRCGASNTESVDGKLLGICYNFVVHAYILANMLESARPYVKSNSFGVRQTREMIEKTGSFMSAEFRDLDEATKTFAGISLCIISHCF